MAANLDMINWCKDRVKSGLGCLLKEPDCMACDIIWEAAIAFNEAAATNRQQPNGQPEMPGICPSCGNYLKPCTRPGVLECGDFVGGL